MFKGAGEKSTKLRAHYRQIAESQGCGYIDIGAEVQAGDQDGIHIDPKHHRIIAEKVAEYITRNLDQAHP